jgi:hypothetical protein
MDDVTQPSATTIPEISSRHVYQNKRISPSNVRSRRTSIDKLLYSSKDYARLKIRTRSLSLRSDLDTWYEWPSSPAQRCSSPDSMWPCTGYCVPASLKEPNVVGRHLQSMDTSSSSDVLNRFHWLLVKTINYHGRMPMERQ